MTYDCHQNEAVRSAHAVINHNRKRRFVRLLKFLINNRRICPLVASVEMVSHPILGDTMVSANQQGRQIGELDHQVEDHVEHTIVPLQGPNDCSNVCGSLLPQELVSTGEWRPHVGHAPGRSSCKRIGGGPAHPAVPHSGVPHTLHCLAK